MVKDLFIPDPTKRVEGSSTRAGSDPDQHGQEEHPGDQNLKANDALSVNPFVVRLDE